MFKHKRIFLIIQELREARYERAAYISKSCVRAFEKAKRFKEVLSDPRNQTPSSSWLYNFCPNHGIQLKTPETLEKARHDYCTRLRVKNFFDTFAILSRTIDPHLLFNADETSSATTKKFKALLTISKLTASIVADKYDPHIT